MKSMSIGIVIQCWCSKPSSAVSVAAYKLCGLANGISMPLILQRGLTNKDPVAIRTLLFRAQVYMKNCKKAMSTIAMSSESPYKDYTKNGNLPSGMVHDDYLMYVRLKMYDVLVNNSAGGDVTCINDGDDAPLALAVLLMRILKL